MDGTRRQLEATLLFHYPLWTIDSSEGAALLFTEPKVTAPQQAPDHKTLEKQKPALPEEPQEEPFPGDCSPRTSPPGLRTPHPNSHFLRRDNRTFYQMLPTVFLQNVKAATKSLHI